MFLILTEVSNDSRLIAAQRLVASQQPSAAVLAFKKPAKLASCSSGLGLMILQPEGLQTGCNPAFRLDPVENQGRRP